MSSKDGLKRESRSLMKRLIDLENEAKAVIALFIERGESLVVCEEFYTVVFEKIYVATSLDMSGVNTLEGEYFSYESLASGEFIQVAEMIIKGQNISLNKVNSYFYNGKLKVEIDHKLIDAILVTDSDCNGDELISDYIDDNNEAEYSVIYLGSEDEDGLQVLVATDNVSGIECASLTIPDNGDLIIKPNDVSRKFLVNIKEFIDGEERPIQYIMCSPTKKEAKTGALLKCFGIDDEDEDDAGVVWDGCDQLSNEDGEQAFAIEACFEVSDSEYEVLYKYLL